MAAPLPEVELREVAPGTVPLPLLLEADPAITRIESYLTQSRCLGALVAGELVGVSVVGVTAPGIWELMNIAVAPHWQRRGIGSRLLEFTVVTVRGWGGRRLELGTGAFGHQVGWYQRAGFRQVAADRGFFLRAYAEPIFEDGRQHLDRVWLALEL